MKFLETSKLYTLNKSTYVNLRWIAYLGQLIAILSVEFIFNFKFDYIICIIILLFSIFFNLYLHLAIKENQLNSQSATIFLIYDILQLSLLFYFTGGIVNPFIFLIIFPAVFSSQYLSIKSSLILVFFTTCMLIFLTFFKKNLPHPGILHFHVPDYYLFSIPIAIFIGLNFLVFFGIKFGRENRKRKEAYDKIQEIMAKENELVSLGGQAAAAAHSLGTPLSTILLTAKELQKDNDKDEKFKNDLKLLVSQSYRCSEILRKLTLNPKIDDEFLDNEITMDSYIYEIVKSYQKISNKKFVVELSQFKTKIKSFKSPEIVYGLRNFIGNANKFSNKNVKITLKSDVKKTEVIILDDGSGFPKDLIDKAKLGEPYIRTKNDTNISKHGLGLGTFFGKTLLERNFAKIYFSNSEINGAEVKIIWENSDLKKIS